MLLDNNQEQKISFFAQEKASETATAVASSRGQLTFTNRPGPKVAAAIVLLFDELNTGLTEQALGKKDFLRYLRGLPIDSRIAVFVLGARVKTPAGTIGFSLGFRDIPSGIVGILHVPL